MAALVCPAHARLAPACDVLRVDQRPAKPAAPAAATLSTHREQNAAGRGGGGRRAGLCGCSVPEECTLLAATPNLAPCRVASQGQATLLHLWCSWRVRDVSQDGHGLHLRAISVDSKSMFIHRLPEETPQTLSSTLSSGL